jgi:hypothetical protein
LNGQSDDNSDTRLLAAGAFLKYLKEYISEGILSLICIAICGKILDRELFYFQQRPTGGQHTLYKTEGA